MPQPADPGGLSGDSDLSLNRIFPILNGPVCWEEEHWINALLMKLYLHLKRLMA
jgi:hypothetical protein